MLKREDYRLSKNVTNLKLRKNGFRNNTYKCNVYKDMFYLFVIVDIDNSDWSYQVVDKNNKIYFQYYDREFGSNEIIEKIDDTINEVISEMIKENILVEVRKYGQQRKSKRSK